MIASVLVANRGEIAVRIIRTCRQLGVRTIAVYSAADADALHVRLADDAVAIGPAAVSESYLRADRILDAARRAGADSVHPGYGFLSENALFAQECLDAGLIWIGPPPRAMRALGDKARAKELAQRSGVPTLPGYHGDDQSEPTLLQHARRIGAPLLVKASAGGGGRGMRLVEDVAQFQDALTAARREAMSSFGDDRVLLERYVRRPRHVEVQIIGDQDGGLVHLGERECSIQRRHQKLIEETPSPAVDETLRVAMGEAAVRLAAAAGYSNAGTVEFLLDEHGEFSFLEVNARLQVEHPITEALTGLDLVELQLRVASGERLPFDQTAVRRSGHAIEARVVAEDPLAGWTPSTGRIDAIRFPDSVRVDSWIEPGTRVSAFYDSLLAKVIAHAPSRSAAVAQLSAALRETRLDGVRNNIDLLLAVLGAPDFGDGRTDTAFLESHQVIESLNAVPPPVLAAAAAVDALATSGADAWHRRGGWRSGRLEQPAVWLYAGRRHGALVTHELSGRGVRVEVGDASLLAHAASPDVVVEGERLLVHDVDRDLRLVEWQGRSYRLLRPVGLESDAGQRPASSAGSGSLTAPMPGRVVKLLVQTGDHVEQNQPLLVMEAMKMEHVVEAPHSGTVSELCVQVGDQLSAGTLLLRLGTPSA